MDDNEDRSDELAEVERLKMFKGAGWTASGERRFFFDHIAKPVMTKRDRIARAFHASLQAQGLFAPLLRNFKDISQDELSGILVGLADTGFNIHTHKRRDVLLALCERAAIDPVTIDQKNPGSRYEKAMQNARGERPSSGNNE
jgi:hypothetical protein